VALSGTVCETNSEQQKQSSGQIHELKFGEQQNKFKNCVEYRIWDLMSM